MGATAYEEGLPLRSPTGEELPPEQVVAMFRGYYESLPPDQFPIVDVPIEMDDGIKLRCGISRAYLDTRHRLDGT